ncbi:TetR/AcrR family transcriptional regulator [Azospirillum sp. RWY-5-1]|uniref:TetR/AcrR family transcriptional regulator n=1 Tax=Azospirillum oleiclasticum TaxID=2735135 RepID=A0ABX2TBW3_9PROT|nr:TetR/AcrR family transcriptional regulator [Azospirillum oleiclasticum]NYZ20736.1 TetR/AcrR family transcriptional regulator [Azospirillum oleiclasticum]
MGGDGASTGTEGWSPPPKRGDRKRADIVAAAERQFLECGYGAASMDRIAADAGASKRTVYNHFPSKEDLFRAVVEGLYRELLGAAPPPAGGIDPAEALTAFATGLLAHTGNPRLQALIRLVIAENPRFPELTAIYSRTGKEPAVARLSEWLAGEAAAGRLRIEQPTIAAIQFLGCLKEALFWPRLLGIAPALPADTVVREAVATFLARHAPADGDTP